MCVGVVHLLYEYVSPFLFILDEVIMLKESDFVVLLISGENFHKFYTLVCCYHL